VAESPKLRKIGLARALSKLGYCSRSDAFDRIRSGRVSLNGRIVRNPENPVHVERDRITVDGKAIARVTNLYFMLNKPRGIITTASDEKNRKTVYAFLGESLPWVSPVGRLDKASEGLLLLTNDSEWSARVLDPATHLDKTYHVHVGVVAGERLLQQLRTGVEDEDGGRLRVKRVRVLRGGEKNSWLEIVLDEGKNRQIRRMLEHLGIEVLRLIRVAIGPVALGELAKGDVRPLTAGEKQQMDRAMWRREKR
jgi:23S rRNA pseudouridine2605 synthase